MLCGGSNVALCGSDFYNDFWPREKLRRAQQYTVVSLWAGAFFGYCGISPDD
jgi:hypothetical protein